MDNSRELWGRIGATLALTPEEERIVFGGDPDAIAQVVRNIFAEGRFCLDGDSYFPGPCVGEFNAKYDTAYAENDIDYLL